jgi:hypothetical protein
VTQHRNIDYGQRLPEAFLDAIQEYVSTLLVNFNLTISGGTTLVVPAGIGNAQVGAGINGRWRWITSNVSAAHPAGPAGQYDVFLTASDNSFTGGAPETDNTVYTFGMVILAQGNTPGTALYRKVAETTWTGSAITRVVLKAGQQAQDLDLATLRLTGGGLLFPDGSVQTSAGGRPAAVGNVLAAMDQVEGVNPGIAGDVRTSLQVSLGSGLQVVIAAGGALIQGDDAVGQGMYYYLQSGNVNLSVPGNAAGNPRVDSVFIQTNDSQYTTRTPVGAVPLYAQGAATSGATLANRSGAPALPPSALRLADVLVPGGSPAAPSAVGDLRKPSGPAVWGEDGRRYRIGVDVTGRIGVEAVV